MKHKLLVLGQFACLLGLLYCSSRPLGMPSWICILTGSGLGLLTLLFNRPGNFNISPQLKTEGRLIMQGPYRWIRHPMYTAVMLVATGLALSAGTWPAWLLWIALGWILLSKAHIEETLMIERFPKYASYQQRTRRFIPYVF